MADLKQFLDFAGLSEYDKLLKEYIKTGSTDEIKKMAEEMQALSQKDSEHDEQIASLNQALAVLNSDDSVAGSIDSKVKKAVDDLVDGAPETFDTLKEIASWISEDETGTSALINRVSNNEEAIENLKKENADLKAYVDAQDQEIYNSIIAIKNLEIKSLFPVKQAEDQTAVQAIAAVAEGEALELAPEQQIEEDVVITKSCYINAKGSTFTGTVTVPADIDVIIENATFSNPVVVQ